MPKRLPERTNEQRWKDKIDKLATRAFGKSVVKKSATVISKYALKGFCKLCDTPSGHVESRDITALREVVGIPKKFFRRSLAVLERSGVVRSEFTDVSVSWLSGKWRSGVLR